MKRKKVDIIISLNTMILFSSSQLLDQWNLFKNFSIYSLQRINFKNKKKSS